jgi:hypothetical protein
MDIEPDMLLTVRKPEPNHFASQVSSVPHALGLCTLWQTGWPTTAASAPGTDANPEAGVQVDDSHPLLVAARHGRLDALKQQLEEMGPAFAAVADKVLLLLLLLLLLLVELHT